MLSLEFKTLACCGGPVMDWTLKINGSSPLFVQLGKLSPGEGSSLLREMGLCLLWSHKVFLHPSVAQYTAFYR